MPYPQIANKHRERALFTPKDFFRYLRSMGEKVPRAPSTIVLCFSPRLTKFAVESLHARPEPEAPREFVIQTPRGRIGIVETQGIGAPALAATMEELIARGARRFVSVGLAGSLQSRLNVGATVLCTRAIRDEGTSHHYVRPGKYAYASVPLSNRLQRGLEARNLPVIRGASWTVDAVYRETLPEIRTYRKAGVLTVDMEASALFSIAGAAGVESAALFTVSDILDETGWVPRFREAGTHLQSLLKETVGVLSARS